MTSRPVKGHRPDVPKHCAYCNHRIPAETTGLVPVCSECYTAHPEHASIELRLVSEELSAQIARLKAAMIVAGLDPEPGTRPSLHIVK